MHSSLDETTREQKAYFKKSLKERIPYEMRPVDPQQWSRGKVTDPKRYTWVRVTGNVGKAGQNDGGNIIRKSLPRGHEIDECQ